MKFHFRNKSKGDCRQPVRIDKSSRPISNVKVTDNSNGKSNGCILGHLNASDHDLRLEGSGIEKGTEDGRVIYTLLIQSVITLFVPFQTLSNNPLYTLPIYFLTTLFIPFSYTLKQPCLYPSATLSNNHLYTLPIHSLTTLFIPL